MYRDSYHAAGAAHAFLRRLAGRASAVALLAALIGTWGPAALAQQVKVGFVDVPRVLDKAPQAEEARSRIEAEFAPKDRSLLKQQKELREQEDRLIRDREVLSAAERARLERDTRTLKREIRRAQEEFRDDLNLRRNQELGKLQQKVIGVIQALAKTEDYDLVISDGVLFAGSRVDITDKVLARLKDEFGRKR